MFAAVLLAAGASERMGRCKALLPIGGRAAVDVIVDTLREGGASPVVVVIGRHAAEIRAEAKLADAVVVHHKGWEKGRTSSIQAALREVPPEAVAVVLALVDMPFVRATTVRTLIESFQADPAVEAVVPTNGGRRGHPIVLARALFERIAALGPDEPLRALVRTARTTEVPVPDPGILSDLDTPEDVAAQASTA